MMMKKEYLKPHTKLAISSLKNKLLAGSTQNNPIKRPSENYEGIGIGGDVSSLD